VLEPTDPANYHDERDLVPLTDERHYFKRRSESRTTTRPRRRWTRGYLCWILREADSELRESFELLLDVVNGEGRDGMPSPTSAALIRSANGGCGAGRVGPRSSARFVR
jgi:hypothetical protein